MAGCVARVTGAGLNPPQNPRLARLPELPPEGADWHVGVAQFYEAIVRQSNNSVEVNDVTAELADACGRPEIATALRSLNGQLRAWRNESADDARRYRTEAM